MSAAIPEGFVRIPMIDVKALAKEQRAKMKAEAEEVTLTLSRKEAQAFYRAADDIEFLFGITDTFLETLRNGISGGFLSGNENGLNALLELGARGMRHATENEGRLMGQLGMHFRDQGVKYPDQVTE